MTRTHAPPREPPDPSGVRSSGEPAPERESAELLRRIRRGDADAFEAVAREVSPRLFGLALRLTGRREDAEDLVQETLVRALPALRRFEGRARLSTYLLRALGNLWKNRLRSRSRSRLSDWIRPADAGAGDERGAVVDPPDPGPSAVEVLETEDRAARVRAAVARLHPDRRLVLLLREVEGCSYEDIAATLVVPVGTVRSRLARAREDLRRLLGDRP